MGTSNGIQKRCCKKLYYVDGHERPEQQHHRSQFIKDYLTRIERRCHRWVQLTHEELECLHKMLGNRNILNRSYQFEQFGVEMFEFHVDDHEEIQKIADIEHPDFGGSTSVRSDPGEKPIIIFGQDKAIYNQNSSKTYQWVGPNSERPLLPKNNGMGKMVSAFQSRESGWGIEMTDEQLHQVNLN